MRLLFKIQLPEMREEEEEVFETPLPVRVEVTTSKQ
jgi:hypothetical protein